MGRARKLLQSTSSFTTGPSGGQNGIRQIQKTPSSPASAASSACDPMRATLKRFRVPLLILAVVGIGVGALLVWDHNRPGPTRTNLEQVREGMTGAEAEALLGPPSGVLTFGGCVTIRSSTASPGTGARGLRTRRTA